MLNISYFAWERLIQGFKMAKKCIIIHNYPSFMTSVALDQLLKHLQFLSKILEVKIGAANVETKKYYLVFNQNL